MLKPILRLLLFCSATFTTHSIIAKETTSLSIDWYQGNGDVNGFRLGVIPYTLSGNELSANSAFLRNSEISFEAAIAHWRQSARDETLTSLILTPTFRHFFYELAETRYFWEIGIGLALHDANKIERREFGSFYNFEDHVGIGIQLTQQHNFTLRYFHYSNANLKFPNTGIDFIGLNYQYQF